MTGSSRSADTQVVMKPCQPPAEGGSLRVRRATTVFQSIACMSTMKPPRSSSDLRIGVSRPVLVSVA